ncbi:plasmid partitioning protein RepB [Celeribacter indicus]|uniref:Plasmid partitioning protein RepB-8 n=1 Tax=Celeribacter indicus TaxID=1208324 RepID=A0A0B5E7S8_9RHOB|nr:plasmid partitioning protein RepB [Celeribacter indicus]AJE49106.1 plasmid partitioning protein RepB-8 [Celeribacter indicus]SDX48663.1 chromosome partitioning protein, ParB family [Celeribacter indicus]
MARKGILSTQIPQKADAKPQVKPRMMPQGAVGALQSSLSRLQENAVQDIDPTLIDEAGLEDRLGLDWTAQRQLEDSIRTYGQQVPVLLRPNPARPGRYEIVYGRRRLIALKAIGQPVKAMIRQLDDQALVMAQGQENTARQDLSFIEKANFAAQLQEAGYDRQTIAAALSMDLPMVSRMLKVGTAFKTEFLRKIGSAPSIGRERWMLLVKCFEEDPSARTRARTATAQLEFSSLSSDDRFETVLARAQGGPAPSPAPSDSVKRQVIAEDGQTLAEVKATRRGTAVTFPAREDEGFATWIAENADDLVQELHARWQQGRAED